MKIAEPMEKDKNQICHGYLTYCNERAIRPDARAIVGGNAKTNDNQKRFHSGSFKLFPKPCRLVGFTIIFTIL